MFYLSICFIVAMSSFLDLSLPCLQLVNCSAARSLLRFPLILSTHRTLIKCHEVVLGGSLSHLGIPPGWHCSNFRQVPDTQELLLFPNSNVSMILEVLEQVAQEDLTEAAKLVIILCSLSVRYDL
jgi:hypothetical protein